MLFICDCVAADDMPQRGRLTSGDLVKARRWCTNRRAQLQMDGLPGRWQARLLPPKVRTLLNGWKTITSQGQWSILR